MSRSNGGSLQAQAGGLLLAVITNQPDVGNGLIAQSEADAMHETVARELPAGTVKVCFHREDEHRDCRQPKPDMILEVARELGIHLTRSFMVGDRSSDVEAGRAAGWSNRSSISAMPSPYPALLTVPCIRSRKPPMSSSKPL